MQLHTDDNVHSVYLWFLDSVQTIKNVGTVENIELCSLHKNFRNRFCLALTLNASRPEMPEVLHWLWISVSIGTSVKDNDLNVRKILSKSIRKIKSIRNKKKVLRVWLEIFTKKKQQQFSNWMH